MSSQAESSVRTETTKSARGFTLIELLVVIAIIGILAGLVISAVGQARIKARDVARVALVREIQNALELYHNDFNRYPSAAVWYQLNTCPSSGIYLCLGDALKPYIKIPDSLLAPLSCPSATNCGWYQTNAGGTWYTISVLLEGTTLLANDNTSSTCYTPATRYCACMNCAP